MQLGCKVMYGMKISYYFRNFASMITPNDATWRIIRNHRTDDVHQLALMGVKESEVDLPLALQQIQGWQTARTKLPS